MPAAIGGSLTINFDAGISSVTAFGTTITTSGNSIEDISADDGTVYTGVFMLNSGYAIDTITYSGYPDTGTLSGYTENNFSLVAGVGGIYGTLTITTKKNANPYNITTSKPKIVIHCEGKAMADNLVITNEIYMGEFEEIVSGFTLTINTNTDGIVLSGSGIYYSLDNGSSWNEITSETITIENATQIQIKSEFTYGMLNIGTTEGGNNIYSELGYQVETDNITLDKDTTIYITNIGYPGM